MKKLELMARLLMPEAISLRLRLLILLKIEAMYLIIFVVLYPSVGGRITALTVLPVVTAAWLFGLRLGSLLSVGLIAATIVTLSWCGSFPLIVAFQQALPGAIALLLLVGLVGWSRDLLGIVQRQAEALKENEATYRALLGAIPDGFVHLNREGLQLQVKPPIGFKPIRETEDLLNQKLSDRLPSHISDLILQHIQIALDTKQLQTFEYEVMVDDQPSIREVRINPFKPDEVIAVIREVTKDRLAEQALQEAKESAEMANRAKSTFLAKMSHELRTPLNAILGFAQLMQRDKSLNAEQKQNLNIVNRSGEYLLRLINDVLEMSKIDAGQMILKPVDFDLHQLLKDLQALFHLDAAQKGLKLWFEYPVDLPQYIRADESKLRQILVNLIGNAIKFTNEGMVVVQVAPIPLHIQHHLNSDLTQRCSGRICLQFEVQDTGLGIPREEQAYIFNAFTQIDASEENQQGTGLGLPISQQFVRLLGDELQVESEPNQGTTFRFAIPVELAQAAVAPAPPTRRVVGLQPHQPEYRLLVVEDQAANRLLLTQLLTMVGFKVRAVENGKLAVQTQSEWQPDLIWMDMRMPVMDGYQATQQIKATASEPKPVVIALTASAFEEDRKNILAAGCDDFVRKPFQEQEIFDLIAKYLEVQYIYADPVESEPVHISKASQNLALTMAQWPEATLIDLQEAVKTLDFTTARHIVEHLAPIDAEARRAILELLDGFRFDTLQHLLDQVSEEMAIR